MKQSIWLGITIVAFLLGLSISYGIFSSTYDPATMKFRNQELFEQMMSQNPKMTQSWMDSSMIQNPSGLMSEMSFNVNAPIIIPMIDAYYNGERIYFIHTEVSDENMAQMMSTMINFPTLHVEELKSIPKDKLAKIYVFTNGVPGMGPYGGGPFMYQIDVFDSVPEENSYSQFRVPYLVTWNEGESPRVLTSAQEVLDAEKNGELIIVPDDDIVNVPVIIWKSQNGETRKASNISGIFKSMPDVEGQIVMADPDMYVVRMNLISKDEMRMMDKMN